MSYLDKDVMYYFKDEIEKEANFIGLLTAGAKGVGTILKASAKGAKKGAESFGKLMSRASTMGNQTRVKVLKDGTEKMVTNADPTSLRHVLGATAAGVGTIYAANKGVKAYKATRQKQSKLPQATTSGNVNLNTY